jgi:Ca-activated chloride channel family protein
MKRRYVVLLIVVMLIVSGVFLGMSGLVRWPSLAAETAFPHIRSLVLNRKANALFLLQNYPGAFDNYVKTLEYDPFSAETHLDLGLTYEMQQQADKAMLSYQNSLLFAKDDLPRFMSLFNIAQLHGKAKKIDEALEFYQNALKIDPSSKEVKTNIELLIQQQQQDQKDGKDDKNKDDKDKDKDKKDQDKKDGKDPKKDPKDDKKDQGKGDQDKDKEPPKDPKDPKDKEKEQPKEYGKNQKPQPKKFDSKELTEGDVKKILQELKQQEQKIRADFNRKEVKEQPRDKDW